MQSFVLPYEPLVIISTVALPREEWLAFRKTGIITAILIALKLAGTELVRWAIGVFTNKPFSTILCRSYTSLSQHKDSFILKGGVILYLRVAQRIFHRRKAHESDEGITVQYRHLGGDQRCVDFGRGQHLPHTAIISDIGLTPFEFL